jgi:hypothetical protein
MSEFKSTNDRNKLFDLLNKIYECGDNINLPKSFSMSTMTSEVRFSDEEHIRLMRQVESDLEDIARYIFAREFAEQDLKPLLLNPENDPHTLEETFNEWNRRRIHERADIYRAEFKKNGIKNLRFKMFYKITDDESDT